MNNLQFGMQGHDIDLSDIFELFSGHITAVQLKDYTDNNVIRAATDIGSGVFDFKYLFKLIKKNKPYIDLCLDETPLEKIPSAIKYQTCAWQELD